MAALSEQLKVSARLRPPDYAMAWLDTKLARRLSPKTIERYLEDLHVWNLDLSTATLPEIQARLAACSQHYSRAGLRRIAITVKQVLRSLERDTIAAKIKLPAPADARVVIYSKDDIEKLLKECRCLRDRLLIEILAETGARRGELHNMCIKDIQFDRFSPIIWLHGKTGTRTRRVYVAKQDLQRYLEYHPRRHDPEARFWITEKGRPLAYEGLYKIIKKLGWRALKRPIFPHGFRHTAATADASRYTDREMMIRFGWDTPAMVGVYAHLSARDVDEKDLAMHGLRPMKSSQEPLIETRVCPQCKAENGAVAVYCVRCNEVLSSAGPEELRKLQEKNVELEKRLLKQDQHIDDIVSDLRKQMNEFLASKKAEIKIQETREKT